MIVVLGSASGGTSMVAGILHALGVDMGRIPANERASRRYPRFECQGCWNMVCSPAWPVFAHLPVVAPEEMVAMFKRYQSARSAAPLAGVKHMRLAWMGQCEEVIDLGLRVVSVTRPLDDCLESCLRYAADVQEASRQATWLGLLAWSRREFFRRVPPTCVVDYYEALSHPAWAVDALVSTLRLEPTPAQVSAAIAMVDPTRRNV